MGGFDLKTTGRNAGTLVNWCALFRLRLCVAVMWLIGLWLLHVPLFPCGRCWAAVAFIPNFGVIALIGPSCILRREGPGWFCAGAVCGDRGDRSAGAAASAHEADGACRSGLRFGSIVLLSFRSGARCWLSAAGYYLCSQAEGEGAYSADGHSSGKLNLQRHSCAGYLSWSIY